MHLHRPALRDQVRLELAGLARGRRDVRDGKAEDATRQPEQVRAFRDTWELGIHSYLALPAGPAASWPATSSRSRGSIFVQIGDENVHLVRAFLDEVFGARELRAP